MRFSVITLFPEMVEGLLQQSMMGRARERGLFSVDCHQLRDYADNRYGKIDDRLSGGGTGLLIQAEPVQRCLDDLLTEGENVRKIFLSPKGRVLNQELVEELHREDHLLLLCGHYEGIDQRVLDRNHFEEVSIGDYVLTGGEYGAAILIDAVARLLPGVLPNEEAYAEESHYEGRLECLQYTKPALWRGMETPAVLLGGHHQKMQQWKWCSSLAETLKKRPDLFDALPLSEEDYYQLALFLEEAESIVE